MTVLDDSKFILTATHLVVRTQDGDHLAPRNLFVQPFMLNTAMLDHAVYFICPDRVVESLNNRESVFSLSTAERNLMLKTFAALIPGILQWKTEEKDRRENSIEPSDETPTPEEEAVEWPKQEKNFSIRKILGF